MRYKIYILLTVLCLLNVACSSTLPSLHPYKVDIQQGNVITYKMVNQLKPSMTKSQVRFIMGTPLIQDTFHSNRWDYFYQMRKDGKVFEQRRVILEFKDDKLVGVSGDTVTEAAIDPISTSKSALLEAESKEGLWDRLKFWKKDDTIAPIISSAKADMAQSKVAETAKFEVTAVDAPKVEISKIEVKPIKEQPSILAIPIEAVQVQQDAPSVSVEKEEAVTSAVPDAPVAESIADNAQKPLLKAPELLQVSQLSESVENEAGVSSLILDKVLTLDLARLKQRVLTPLAGTAVKLELAREIQLEFYKPNPMKESEQKAADPPPGYFERMLEKIGF